MDTQHDLLVEWFPEWLSGDWMVAATYWKGALQYFHDTQSSMSPSYEAIVNAARKVVPPGIAVSKATFERARRHFKEKGLEQVMPKPSTITDGMRPPWVDDPNLIEAYRPAAVTLPLPMDRDEEIEKVLLRTDSIEFVGCKGGAVRWRTLLLPLAPLAAVHVVGRICHMCTEVLHVARLGQA